MSEVSSSDSLSNPYLDLFATLTEESESEFDQMTVLIQARSELVKRFAWSIPNREALSAIASRGPVVEIGAGAGYWAYCLSQLGTDVVAYDIAPAGVSDNEYTTSVSWFEVSYGGPGRAAEHPDRTLLLCWPPYDDPFAADGLAHFKGDRVVFIGEGRGGCTGDDRFFATLEHEFTKVKSIAIPTWVGVHDSVSIYQRAH